MNIKYSFNIIAILLICFVCQNYAANLLSFPTIEHKSVENKDTTTKHTIPLTNEQITQLIDELPVYEYEDKCLTNETCALKWVGNMNMVYGKVTEKASFLKFQYSTNITDENSKLSEDFASINNRFNKIIFDMGRKFSNHSDNWNEDLKRMLLLTRFVDFYDSTVVNITNKLQEIYSNAKVCKADKCNSLEPELNHILASSRDYDELLWAWKGWCDATGPKMRNLFTESVLLQNKAVRDFGFDNIGEQWIEELEYSNLRKTVDELYNSIKPLYQQLHAYVRRKLQNYYGKNRFSNSNTIQMHLLGNMWAQDWGNIFSLVTPYPEVKMFNLTEKLQSLNFTTKKLFTEAENFFLSIGLYPMTETFWKYSLLEKPIDRNVVCHASASDLFNGYDFRIKMCTNITGDYFTTIHHEMGHIEYYMSYKNQPNIFKNGANSGFQEAIGDTISLSTGTLKHLRKFNISQDDNSSNESNMNVLMLSALINLPLIPFAYTLEKWRWNVFNGDINETNYNQEWWRMIKQYQGLEPAVERNESYFDPGAKFHVAANVPYIRYFISTFHQFQFYKALCQLSDHKGPLNTCDFYNSTKAGTKLKEMLSLGRSKHWKEALNVLTGVSDINANAILEYYQPLYEWLKIENEKFPDELIGW